MNSIKEEVTLRECPFCGAEDVELRETITDAQVCCNCCGSRTGLASLGADDRANAYQIRMAVTVWNTRQSTSDLRAKAEGLAEALRMIAIVDQGCGGTLTFQEMAESAMRQAHQALSEWDQSQ